MEPLDDATEMLHVVSTHPVEFILLTSDELHTEDRPAEPRAVVAEVIQLRPDNAANLAHRGCLPLRSTSLGVIS